MWSGNDTVAPRALRLVKGVIRGLDDWLDIYVPEILR
jgi:hypothetical protein